MSLLNFEARRLLERMFFLENVRIVFHVKDLECISEKILTDYIILFFQSLFFISSVRHRSFSYGFIPVLDLLNTFVLELH